MPYLSDLEVCSWRGAIQIRIHFYLPYLSMLATDLSGGYTIGWQSLILTTTVTTMMSLMWFAARSYSCTLWSWLPYNYRALYTVSICCTHDFTEVILSESDRASSDVTISKFITFIFCFVVFLKLQCITDYHLFKFYICISSASDWPVMTMVTWLVYTE